MQIVAHDKRRQLLIYETADPGKMLSIIPGAVALSANQVATPVNLYNLQLLRYIEAPIIAPMTEETYDFPIRPTYRARDHQKLMANFMVAHPRSFNLSDPGTMKTLPALWAADFVMLQYPGTKTLIVCTLSTMQEVWLEGIFKDLIGKREGVILHGSKEKRKKQLADMSADFYIVNFDGVEVLREELDARTDIRICLVDECSAYKDASTKRHKCARATLAKRDYLWMMTGTPTSQGPLDAYGQAKLVNNAFGESFTQYKNRVMYKVSMFKWVPRVGAHENAYNLLRPAIRFAIEDCWDLPPCTTEMRHVELTSEQQAAYKTMKNDLQLMMNKGLITAPSEAVLRMKLLQIACGAVYNQKHEVHYINASTRIAVLREVLEQTKEKVIIFAPLTSVLHLLYKELHDYTREIINGNVSPKERSRIFRDFQYAADPRIIIADPGTMSHGLTLTAATTIVWYAPTDKTETYLQANKRIDRPGQVKSTRIVQIAATTIEKEIYRRLESNESMQGVMLKMVEER
jgi:SNF2 family DNA or RNA helicase